MLRALSIRDVLLIESLDLEFGAGLNVLTGETGAGKSILLDCLGFVLGGRGRADLVRQGADSGEVVAEFDLAEGHAARPVLAEAGFAETDRLVLRRLNTRDGRKRAFVNDRAASSELLRLLSDALVEIHGQHDDQGLLNPRAHIGFLDAFGDYLPLQDGVRATWRDWAHARRELRDEEQALEAAARDAEFLRHSVAELEALNPQAGEDAALDTKRRLMQAAGRIREDIAKAQAALAGEGAEGQMSDAIRWLEAVSDKAEGRLEGPIDALSRALTELGEAQSAIEDALEELQFDPQRLEQVEERLFALRGVARKHNVSTEELPDLQSDLVAQLEALDTGSERIRALRHLVASTEEAYRTSAGRLSEARRAAASELDARVAAELPPLRMDRAAFCTEISPADPGPDGTDAVAFTVATNPGAPAGPIAKIASGGELSRFLLALKVCLAQATDGVTMIFDEIDRGVGGATADAVGRRLAAVAEGSQVLVVTHSPQVAALGRHHFQVLKTVDGQDRTHITVRGLSDSDRVDEIARMVAGDRITEEARAAARALLLG